MKKGITPVVATILLLLIVVAIVGYSFGFFQKIFSTASSATGSQLNQTTTQIGQSVNIDNAASSSVTVRNIGTASLATSDVGVYINNVPVNGAWDKATLAPSGTATYTYNATTCSPGSTVKVTTSGLSPTATC